jgi:transposase
LRTGYFPLAYDYPQEMRATLDLLRRRQKLVHLRGQFYRHIKLSMYQQGINDFPVNVTHERAKRRECLTTLHNPDVNMAVDTDLKIVEHLDKLIPPLEHQVRRQAKAHDGKSLAILKTIEGVGDTLGLNLLYEIHTVKRFATVQRFSSYGGVVRVPRSSAGKKSKGGNQKIRNPYLRWALGEVACLSLKYYPSIKKNYEKTKARVGARKALQRLAHKFAVAIYYMLKTGSAFDVNRFAPGA